MTPVLSVAQMRAIEHQTIGSDTAKGYGYMQKAGAGLFDAAHALMADCKKNRVAVVCGKGNNGGDGYVAARLLLYKGYAVQCYSVVEPDDVKGEARLAQEEYVACQGKIQRLRNPEDCIALSACDLIVDAILGTGLKNAPTGLIAQTIEAINCAGVPVIAADTPSGLDCDTGIPYAPCIKATVTVTMGFPKIGFFHYPGRSTVGRLIVCDLGYPDKIVEPKMYLPTLAALKKMVPPRKPFGSKFDHGVAFMLAGSRGMVGSAVLASRAALRSGCGMVQLGTPLSAIQPLSAQVVETVLQSIDETADGTPAYSSLDQCLNHSRHKQVVCIGPGISHHPETVALVRAMLPSVKSPLIVDADGINAFKGAAHLLKGHPGERLITPHAGEWARLFDAAPTEPMALVSMLIQKAREYNLVILYKGSPTIVVDPRGDAFILPYGNSGMATAGSGDVLSGIITGLAAQGCPLRDAAILGAFLHGAAGDAAAEVLGEYSMVAGDVIEYLYRAFNSLLNYK